MTIHLNQHAGDGFANEKRCDVCHNLRTVWVIPLDISGQVWLCKSCLQAGIDEIDAAVLEGVKEKGDE